LLGPGTQFRHAKERRVCNPSCVTLAPRPQPFADSEARYGRRDGFPCIPTGCYWQPDKASSTTWRVDQDESLPARLWYRQPRKPDRPAGEAFSPSFPDSRAQTSLLQNPRARGPAHTSPPNAPPGLGPKVKDHCFPVGSVTIANASASNVQHQRASSSFMRKRIFSLPVTVQSQSKVSK